VTNDAVSKGTVQALKAGDATILATFQNHSGQCAVHVTAAQPDHITITAPAKIAKGTSAALVASLVIYGHDDRRHHGDGYLDICDHSGGHL
jgi:uncharacterized protein YjdB